MIEYFILKINDKLYIYMFEDCIFVQYNLDLLLMMYFYIYNYYVCDYGMLILRFC